MLFVVFYYAEKTIYYKNSNCFLDIFLAFFDNFYKIFSFLLLLLKFFSFLSNDLTIFIK